VTLTRWNDAYSENHTLREQTLWPHQQTTIATTAAVRFKTTAATTTGAANRSSNAVLPSWVERASELCGFSTDRL
jgi:hypothetical protein